MTMTASGAARVGAAIACALGFGGAAMAQSASVTRFGSYYETSAGQSCTGTINCLMSFEALPSKKDVLFDTVSCRLTSSNIPAHLTLSVPPKGGEGYQRRVYFSTRDYVYAKQPSGDTFSYYLAFNTPIKFYVEAGSKPRFDFYASGNNAHTHSMNCTLIGKMLD